jgi:hypothetical protein
MRHNHAIVHVGPWPPDSPDPLTFRARAESLVLRDLATDLAGTHLAPLSYGAKAAAMTSLIDGAAERLAWIAGAT